MWFEESEDITTSQYYHGLKLDIKDIMAFQNFDTADEVQHSTKVEEIVNRRWWEKGHMSFQCQ